MNSEKIKAIAKYIEKNDSVIDVGCDHGYLAIYLAKNKLCQKIIASDISQNALEFAKKNIKKYGLNIKTIVSDGFKNINFFYDTAVIAGMGANTILSILKEGESPDKIIVSSNNDLYLLRKELNRIGYKLLDETIIYEKKHFYSIIYAKKGYQKLSYKKLKFGLSDNLDYYKYLVINNKRIMSVIPFKKRIVLKFDNYILKKIIEKKSVHH